MKIVIEVNSTDDGLKGDFSIVMGAKGIELLSKLRAVIANPDEMIANVGEKVMNGVLYGGNGSKSKSEAVAEQSGGPAGY